MKKFLAVAEVIGWALVFGMIVAIVVSVVTSCRPPDKPITWRGIDRSHANCVDVDGKMLDEIWDRKATCIDAGRRYLCIREHLEFQCVEVSSTTPERPDAP